MLTWCFLPLCIFSGWAVVQLAKLTDAWNVLRVLVNAEKVAGNMDVGILPCISLPFVWTQFWFCKLNDFYLTPCLASSVFAFLCKLSDVRSDLAGQSSVWIHTILEREGIVNVILGLQVYINACAPVCLSVCLYIEGSGWDIVKEIHRTQNHFQILFRNIYFPQIVAIYSDIHVRMAMGFLS